MIPKHLKRAFKLSSKNDPDAFINQLDMVEAEYKTNVILLNAAKEGMKAALKRRDEIMHKILLKKFGYILSHTDQILYMNQTKELRVYDPATMNIGESDGDGQEY